MLSRNARKRSTSSSSLLPAGPPAPNPASLFDRARLFERLRGHPRMRMAFGPHAPYTVGDASMARVRDLAAEFGAGIQMHVHETADEVATAMQAGGEGTGETGWGPIIIATVIAFAVGYAVIAWFMKFIETHTFTPFMIYRIVLALGLFALLGTGTISA